MSGPKISFYSLTGHARAVVLGQYRCDQEQIACAEEIRKMLKEISEERVGIRHSEAVLMGLKERSGGYEARLAEISELQGRLEGELKDLKNEFRTYHPKISRKYRIEDEALEKKKQELKKIRELQKRVSGLYREVLRAASAGDDASSEEAKKARGVIAEYLAGESTEGESAGQEARPGSGRGDSHTVSGRTFEERKEADRAALNRLLKDHERVTRYSVFEGTMEPFPPELVSDIRAALGNLERITQMPYLTSFESVTMDGLLKRAADWERESADRLAQYEKRQAEERKEERRRREAEKWRQLEQRLIADTVDEVMREMGYDLIGRREVRKRSGKHFTNELYRFGEGTAVNVTCSPDGQISMELGGIAGEDRLPSEEEAELLTEDMEAFCGEFAEFERRMRRRGVIVANRVALMPPAPEYASIININDYEKEPGAEAEEISARGRRKKAGQKVSERAAK